MSVSREFLQSTNIGIIYAIIFVIGLYIYWRGLAETHKNRSGIFDSFLLGGLFGLVVSRIAYIIIEWENFTSFIWYWLPYEKYGENIYLFRLLPWKFVNVFDGGLVIFGLFIGLILFLTFYTLVLRDWRWKHVYFPIYLSSVSMLSLSLLFTGFVNEINAWVIKGGILFATVIGFFVAYFVLKGIFKNIKREKYALSYGSLLLTWLSSAYIGYIYINSEISMMEQVMVGVFVLWSVVMGVFFIQDLRKASVSIESISSVRSVNTV